MTVSDEQIGRNIARFRGTVSQKQIASEMRALGWKWSQATMWSLEKGERPLRLAESEDLARVLRVPVTDLLQETDLDADVASKTTAMFATASALLDSAHQYTAARRVLRHLLASAPNSDIRKEAELATEPSAAELVSRAEKSNPLKYRGEDG